jgi:hypothetical protein
LYSENGLATANEYLEFAVKGAAEERALTLNTLERCAKKPALQLIGSCKDSIWNQDLQRYSVKAIADAVNQDVTVVISGSGTTGMPKKWTEIWVTEMRKFEQLFGRRSQSELVRVQCSYAGKEQDRRVFEGGYSETVVTLLSLDARNEFANSIGAKQAMVLAPGGTAELLAFTQAALNRQLFGKMLTPYENIPTFQVLNTGLKELGNNHYYNPLLEQLRVMERYHTINPNEYNAGWFTQLRNPENDAKSLINDLVR